MEKRRFGYMPDGTEIFAYDLVGDGMEVTVLNYAAALQKIVSYGRDVLGGFDTVEGYLRGGGHQGAIVGRYANRIRNGVFTLNGKEYRLEKNCDGGHHLHSGSVGLSKRVWKADVISGQAIRMTIHSPDGEGNYPGNVDVAVTYRVDGNELHISYEATTDADTPLNLTNHAYFNLDGLGGTILDHTVCIHADGISEVDGDIVPTGRVLPVRGTLFDFNTPRAIGERIGGDFGGYDHNYFLRGTGMRSVATAENADRCLTVRTDRTALQFYVGNMLGGDIPFKGGIPQIRHGAFCMETQFAPYSIVSGEAILRAGCTFRSETVYKIDKK